MRSNSIKRLTMDWDGFSSRVLAAGATAQSIPETFPAIRLALELINDGHSSYRASNGTTIFHRVKTCTASGAGTPSLPADIGYVKVTSFSGSGGDMTTFANGIQQQIRDRDTASLAGWIVDLRGNGGGNMWPMLAGVGPVLGEGLAGFFIGPTGVATRWEYADGGASSGNVVVARADNPYHVLRADPRVAVLVDNGVASSGEATFIAFIGRANTRTFGVPTCGLSTANAGFALSDGASLNLTVSTMADRTRRAYGDVVTPDEVIASDADMVARAIAWLRSGT